MSKPNSAAGSAPAGSPRQSGDAVIDRAFAVLGAFDSEHRILSLADLTRATGLPRSTALRLAKKLTETGALERRDDGRYAIGVRMLEIASLAPRGDGLRAVAMPFMEDLLCAIGQHVLLAVRDGDVALLIERLSANDADPVLYRVGGRMPLPSTGVGLVLLAGAPRAVQERIVAGLFADEAGRRADGTAELRRVLADVRRNGYATMTVTAPWPRTSVAAPLQGPDGAVGAALSVVIPGAGIDHGAITSAVRACARAISRELSNVSGENSR